MNNECFVIQPISDLKFTKRFDDIYKPAIESVGLLAYRVDLDPRLKYLSRTLNLKLRMQKYALRIYRLIIQMFGMSLGMLLL